MLQRILPQNRNAASKKRFYLQVLMMLSIRVSISFRAGATKRFRVASEGLEYT
jgi:hypothetical protein